MFRLSSVRIELVPKNSLTSRKLQFNPRKFIGVLLANESLHKIWFKVFEVVSYAITSTLFVEFLSQAVISIGVSDLFIFT